MKKCLLKGCNKPARRKFCCNKHKDRWHNKRRKFDSKSNLRFNEWTGYWDHINPDSIHDEEHPLSSEALGQE
jgi:hypothetical protein